MNSKHPTTSSEYGAYYSEQTSIGRQTSNDVTVEIMINSLDKKIDQNKLIKILMDPNTHTLNDLTEKIFAQLHLRREEYELKLYNKTSNGGKFPLTDPDRTFKQLNILPNTIICDVVKKLIKHRDAPDYKRNTYRSEMTVVLEKQTSVNVSNKSTFEELPHATGKVQLSQPFDQSPVPNSYLACSRNPGVCGLQNIGNTCFINSAVQCLSNVEPLTKYFINEAYQNDINRSNALGTQGEVARAYAHLITRMWAQEQERIEPVQLKRQIARYAPQFDNFHQQDSQEFMNFLIDALHEDLKNNNDSSVVSKLFRGTVETTVQCAQSYCERPEVTENYFTFLSLPIQSRTDGSVTIDSCLKALLADETLGKNGQWLCHSCRKKSDASKTILIRLLPPILILHLKRFNFDRTYEKIDVKVTYPTEGLDLSQYVSIEKHKAQYDLIAVSNHRGFLKGGHYTTVAKNFKNKQWYKFDDDYITPVTHQVDIVSKDAYVLVYQRKGI